VRDELLPEKHQRRWPTLAQAPQGPGLGWLQAKVPVLDGPGRDLAGGEP
jgi:hypothetical protein